MKRTSLVSIFVLASLLLGLLFAAPAQASGAGTCAQYHVVQYGETLYRIGLRYGMSVAQLQSINSLVNPNRIYAGQWLCVQMQYFPRTYVVQPGDWLSKIARQFGVNPWVLASVNNLANPNRIYAGQVLTIPDFTIQ